MVEVTLSAHRLNGYVFQPGAGIGAQDAVVTEGINYEIDEKYDEALQEGGKMDSMDWCIINLKQPAAGPISIEPATLGELSNVTLQYNP